MTTNKYATLRGTIARAKRNDCQKVVMRVTLVEELLLQLSNAEKRIAGLERERVAMEAVTLAMRDEMRTSPPAPVVPNGWVMVPVEPTEDMIVQGFESEPDESFSDADVWEAYEAMSGCQQAAHRAKLCWSAMLTAAPKPEA
ncbi:hypothetical protein [Enterobacter mori]|uniref:hypothetical protein n=1 Tax=Enterobacter mori TaxID=539813 RepID=UPI0032AEBEEE